VRSGQQCWRDSLSGRRRARAGVSALPELADDEVADSLARVAGAQAMCGDRDGAAVGFAAALAAAGGGGWQAEPLLRLSPRSRRHRGCSATRSDDRADRR